MFLTQTILEEKMFPGFYSNEISLGFPEPNEVNKAGSLVDNLKL